MNWPEINVKNRFFDSCGKLLLLLIFTFLPLFINIFIAIITADDKGSAFAQKIVPGEMLAYCLSLISPLFLLFLKTHGERFRVPALKFIFMVSFLLYISAFFLTIIAKNNFINGINYKPGTGDFYFWTSIAFLFCAILLRLYTDFQDSRYSDFKGNLDKSQQEFNYSLKERIRRQ